MSNLLSFVSPLEFLLRYTVIGGTVLAIIGLAVILLAKRVTMAVRKQDTINKQDKVYLTMIIIGVALLLLGMIVIALPVDATFYTI